MTSASELFHNRRSRFGRSSLLELGGSGGGELEPLDSSSSNFGLRRISNHSSPRRRHHHLVTHHHGTATSTTVNTRREHHRPDLDGCDHLIRRASHPRHHPPHRNLLPDRESGWLDQGSNPASEDVNNSQNGSLLRDGLRPAGNDRLPGTVLLARERLLQRLRGVSLSANRQRNRASSSIHHNEFTIGDDIRLTEGDWENEISRELLAETAPLTDNLSVESTKRPPGLTQEALDSLQVEIFSALNYSNEELTPSGLDQCSICLESFLEGDKLIHLTCGHRFHFSCLDPWVRICGDCPNCRKGVLVTSYREIESM